MLECKFYCVRPGWFVVFLVEIPKVPGRRIPNVLFFTIVALAIAQCIHDFPLLPNRLASHFNASGMPNGWMTKTQFMWVYALVLLAALAIEFWAPHQIANRPDSRLRLPNKEYWLAPERRAGTYAYFDTFFAWYGCVFLFVVVYAMGLALRANFDTPARLPTGPIVTVIAGFALFNLAAIIAMLRRFSMPR